MVKADYSVYEVADILGIAKWSVYRRIKEGRLKAYHAGGGKSLMVSHESLVEFCRNNNIPFAGSQISVEAKKLMIVDDDEKIIRALVRFFGSQDDLEVKTASSGFEAGILISEFKPHVIVMDIMLGDINGREVIQNIRKKPEFEDVTVIGISGLINDDESKELLKIGFDYFFKKPLDLLDLTAIVNRCLLKKK